jgi:hypothetical protein
MAILDKIKASRMLWLSSKKSMDIWDDNVSEPSNDLEAAQRIRNICDAASDIAENVGSGIGGPEESERYERAAKTAMRTALKISDDLIRDAALKQIIALCVKANNVRRAEILLRGIQAITIREDVLNENPVLHQ